VVRGGARDTDGHTWEYVENVRRSEQPIRSQNSSRVIESSNVLSSVLTTVRSPLGRLADGDAVRDLSSERGILLAKPEIAAQQLEKREKGNCLSVRHRMSFVDGDSPRAAALHELVAKSALARSRLGDYADDLRISRDCPLKCGLQSPETVICG
jgi:hypothetical protein